VTVIKDLIDLVPFQLVSITGGGSISSLSNGRTSSGTGFIAMDVAVPSNQAPNSTITLNIGLSDKFNMRVVHRGLVSAIVASPQPSTLQVGTPWVATVRGTDLGDAVAHVAAPSCHTAPVLGNRTADSIRFTLTRSATCSTNSFSLTLEPSANDDPPKYVLSSGARPTLNFSYIPPPPVGVACTSNPGLGQAVVRTPGNNQVIVFGGGTSSPTNIVIRWDSLTALGQPVPNNEWVVTRGGGTTTASGLLIGGGGAKGTSVTVVGLSKTFAFTIPGTHTISVRPKNCGQNAPATTVTFSTRYQ
jgi:hypothetical protein